MRPYANNYETKFEFYKEITETNGSPPPFVKESPDLGYNI